jgi:hypothetical protein
MTDKQTAAKLVLGQLRAARGAIYQLTPGEITEAAGKRRASEKTVDSIKNHAFKFIDPQIERMKKLSGDYPTDTVTDENTAEVTEAPANE